MSGSRRQSRPIHEDDDAETSDQEEVEIPQKIRDILSAEAANSSIARLTRGEIRNQTDLIRAGVKDRRLLFQYFHHALQQLASLTPSLTSEVFNALLTLTPQFTETASDEFEAKFNLGWISKFRSRVERVGGNRKAKPYARILEEFLKLEQNVTYVPEHIPFYYGYCVDNQDNYYFFFEHIPQSQTLEQWIVRSGRDSQPSVLNEILLQTLTTHDQLMSLVPRKSQLRERLPQALTISQVMVTSALTTATEGRDRASAGSEGRSGGRGGKGSGKGSSSARSSSSSHSRERHSSSGSRDQRSSPTQTLNYTLPNDSKIVLRLQDRCPLVFLTFSHQNFNGAIDEVESPALDFLDTVEKQVADRLSGVASWKSWGLYFKSYIDTQNLTLHTREESLTPDQHVLVQFIDIYFSKAVTDNQATLTVPHRDVEREVRDGSDRRRSQSSSSKRSGAASSSSRRSGAASSSSRRSGAASSSSRRHGTSSRAHQGQPTQVDRDDDDNQNDDESGGDTHQQPADDDREEEDEEEENGEAHSEEDGEGDSENEDDEGRHKIQRYGGINQKPHRDDKGGMKNVRTKTTHLISIPLGLQKKLQGLFLSSNTEADIIQWEQYPSPTGTVFMFHQTINKPQPKKAPTQLLDQFQTMAARFSDPTRCTYIDYLYAGFQCWDTRSVKVGSLSVGQGVTLRLLDVFSKKYATAPLMLRAFVWNGADKFVTVYISYKISIGDTQAGQLQQYTRLSVGSSMTTFYGNIDALGEHVSARLLVPLQWAFMVSLNSFVYLSEMLQYLMGLTRFLRASSQETVRVATKKRGCVGSSSAVVPGQGDADDPEHEQGQEPPASPSTPTTHTHQPFYLHNAFRKIVRILRKESMVFDNWIYALARRRPPDLLSLSALQLDLDDPLAPEHEASNWLQSDYLQTTQLFQAVTSEQRTHFWHKLLYSFQTDPAPTIARINRGLDGPDRLATLPNRESYPNLTEKLGDIVANFKSPPDELQASLNQVIEYVDDLQQFLYNFISNNLFQDGALQTMSLASTNRLSDQEVRFLFFSTPPGSLASASQGPELPNINEWMSTPDGDEDIDALPDWGWSPEP